MRKAVDTIKAALRPLAPTQEAPDLGSWLACPNGHVIAQWAHNPRTGRGWTRFQGGAVIKTRHGTRRIACGYCETECLNENTATGAFACHVVPDEAVQAAIGAM